MLPTEILGIFENGIEPWNLPSVSFLRCTVKGKSFLIALSIAAINFTNLSYHVNPAWAQGSKPNANQSSSQELYGGNAKSVSANVLDPEITGLVNKLVLQPELMNIEYLQYVIGLPEKGHQQVSFNKKDYRWYQEPGRLVRYSLEQNGPHPEVATDSVFTVHLQNSNLTMKDLPGIFGPMTKQTYDHRSHLTSVYSWTSNTYVAFSHPPHDTHVREIKIGYNGPPLPGPSEEDLQLAYNFRKANMLAAAAAGRHKEAVPWLVVDAKKNPNDANSHLALAESYRGNLQLNQAIKEYYKAIELAPNDESVRGRCVAALVELRVLPPDYARQRPQLQQQSPTQMAGVNAPSL